MRQGNDEWFEQYQKEQEEKRERLEKYRLTDDESETLNSLLKKQLEWYWRWEWDERQEELDFEEEMKNYLENDFFDKDGMNNSVSDLAIQDFVEGLY